MPIKRPPRGEYEYPTPPKGPKAPSRARPKIGQPVVTESCGVRDILGDMVTIDVRCEIKSSVDFVSVGTSMGLSTTISAGDLEASRTQISSYLRNKVLAEHSKLSELRAAGF